MIAMASYDIILFDLDGTLTDPTMEIITSAKYALKQFGIETTDSQRMQLFLETPLLACFEQKFGLSQDQANMAFQHYWHYAGTFGVGRNIPYLGVRELLETLQTENVVMGIATARQTANATKILRVNQLESFFGVVMGTSVDESRRSKKTVIFDALCELHAFDADRVLMIGDRAIDISAAQDNGIDAMAVSYGQESAEQLATAKPKFLIHSVEEMASLLLTPTP